MLKSVMSLIWVVSNQVDGEEVYQRDPRRGDRVGTRSGGTPIHIHPHALETYEVLEGRFDAYVDGIWKTYQAGEKAEGPERRAAFLPQQ